MRTTITIKVKQSFLKRLLAFILIPFYSFRGWLIKKLLSLRAKLQINSLREAIGLADKDKETTGRKNLVVFNAHSGKYEPLQKKALKVYANSTKNTSNKAMTDGRKKMMLQKKPKSRVIDLNRVKEMEEKSLYVTK